MVKKHTYIIGFAISCIFFACGNRNKTEKYNEYDNSESEEYKTLAPVVIDTIDRTIQIQQAIEEISSSAQSEYYQMGYEKGYDDGEDDAINVNDYKTSCDDGNSYSGQNKTDFEKGYCEGYEDGYDDNFESADD